MFQFPSLATLNLFIFSKGLHRYEPVRVSPFGNPRIDARLQLPVAYRSLPRPSSPLGAKASTECP